MKFKKSHILLISLISLFLLLSMSAVSAASDDASIAQATEINDIDAIDDMGNSDILSDYGDGTGGDDPIPDDPGTGETTDPLPVSTTNVTSENKTYPFGSNITFDVEVKDNQSAPITNIGLDSFKVYYKTNTTNYTEIDYNYSDSKIKLDFDTNKTLPVENYTIKIVFVNSVIGGVNYTESEKTLNLTITKTNTTINASDVTINLGKDLIIPLVMKVESNKTLNFNETLMHAYYLKGNENITINFTKVNGGIKLLNFTEGIGNYTIYMYYDGNHNCNPSNGSANLIIAENNTINIKENISVDFGTKNISIPITIDNNGNPIELHEDNITLVLTYKDGTTKKEKIEDFEFANVDGIYTISFVKDVQLNNAKLTIIYANGTLNETSKVISFIEKNTIISDSIINVNNYTHNVSIPIMINHTTMVIYDGKNITNVTTLNLTEDNITLDIKYVNGENNITEPFDIHGKFSDENGNYTINFIIDAEKFNNTAFTIFYNDTLGKINKTVTLNPVIVATIIPINDTLDYQSGEFVFRLIDNYTGENKPLVNTTISIDGCFLGYKMDSGHYKIESSVFTSDEDGYIKIPNAKFIRYDGGLLKTGEYNITFKGSGSIVLNDTVGIKVNQAQAEIIASPLIEEYEDGKNLYYTFKVINSKTGEAIQSVLVQFRIYSNVIDATINGTTNSSGYYKSLPLNLIGGTYNLTLKSLDSNLICSAVKQTITLKQRDAVISASNRTILYGSGITVVATVKDKKTGNPVPNAYVLVKVYITSSKVSNFLVRTDSKGVIRFSTGLSVGKHKVIISMFDTNYKSGSLTRYVTVKKATGQFSAPSVSTYYKSGRYYKVKLTNTKNKALMYASTVNIKVYISKYRYYNLTGVTDANGIVQFKITFKPGTYKVVVSSADKGYSAKAVTSQIKVSKSPIKIAPTSLKVKRYSYFKVKVTSTKSKKVLSGVKVKVRVYTGRKYKTYTIKTNKKGIASLKISQKRGKHKVVLSPGSPTYYYAKAITRTLTVTR